MSIEESANVNEFAFSDVSALVLELTQRIEENVALAIEKKGQAIIAFSGGSTPAPLFKQLRASNIDWSAVIVTLVDERCVPEDQPLSNAGMLRSMLLNHLPVQPKFVSLYYEADNIEAMKEQVLDRYREATGSEARDLQPDIVILGMGSDGHTASFFPDADNISQLVSLDCEEALHSCISASSSVERITWSLPYLLGADFLALFFTGEDKQSVYQQALTGTDATQLPVRSVIHQSKTTLRVYYAES